MTTTLSNIQAVEAGYGAASGRQCQPRRPAATLRQELTLRMAAMSRQPAVSAGAIRCAVVHPADREGQARCSEVGRASADSYEDVSVRLLATAGERVVGTARITLWSPVVGFMVEREVGDPRCALVLGPRTAELSGVEACGDAGEQQQVFVTLARLAARVTAAHGIDYLYVLGAAEHVAAIAAPEVAALMPTAARVDLQAASFDGRHAS